MPRPTIPLPESEGFKWEVIPSEEWPPYKWLWSRIGGRPWTHIMRDHPSLVVPVAVAMLVLACAWAGWHWWKVLLSFFLGMVTGHVFW